MRILAESNYNVFENKAIHNLRTRSVRKGFHMSSKQMINCFPKETVYGIISINSKVKKMPRKSGGRF